MNGFGGGIGGDVVLVRTRECVEAHESSVGYLSDRETFVDALEFNSIDTHCELDTFVFVNRVFDTKLCATEGV